MPGSWSPETGQDRGSFECEPSKRISLDRNFKRVTISGLSVGLLPTTVSQEFEVPRHFCELRGSCFY